MIMQLGNDDKSLIAVKTIFYNKGRNFILSSGL